MTTWIIHTFIRDYAQVDSPKVREDYGKLAGVVGILSNIFLFVIKCLAGLLFHSIAIMADAVNNLSDAGSSIVTLVGFHISGKPADAEHPYGHARMEYISGLVVSFIILLLGVQLVRSSIEKILHPEETIFSLVTVAILLVSIGVKLWQGMFNRTVGKTINSTALIATATDSLNDVFATGAVLLSTLLSTVVPINLDGYMGVVVAIFIIISGIRLVGDTINPLLGTMPDKELVDSIQRQIMSYDGVIGMHDLVVHNYGPERCFASVHVEVPASQDIMISHDIIDNIEREFADILHIHLVIHLDPVDVDDPETNHLREKVKELAKEISPEISTHDFRMVKGHTHTNLIFDVCVPPGFHIPDQDLCAQLTQKLREENPNYFTVITVDRSYISNTVEE